MKSENRTKTSLIFIITLIIAILVFGVSVVKTSVYNHQKHHAVFEGAALLSPSIEATGEVSAKALPRSSTWTKCFDFYNEGLTEHNYQAYTYDISISNNTRDEVSEFTFRLTFSQDVYLMSAWNGALEIHQQVAGGELVATIPDLRDFDAGEYDLNMFTADGDDLVAMKPGDYFVYYPSTSLNALEMPLQPSEGTVPGMILYTAIGEEIEGWSLELDYIFHRLLTSEPLFWIALIGMAVWLIALLIFAITSVQIRQYQERHKRDNEIINESIETFTGFIDAKDPYTNGHSKRVAVYTRQIAKEFGYEGEDLDRIYYIALLHDCGKIGVPDNILGKPGKLTDEEFKVIKSHTVRGGEILSSFRSLENAGEGALYHHERYDGKGYPEGRSGEEIPFIARMICVADSFDAMNTNRVYRKMLTKERIVSEIETNKGYQFDPKIAEVMLRLLKEKKIKM